jgi:hypothetical protein
MMRILALVLFALLTVFVAVPASAAGGVPDSAVRLRIVSHDGVSFSVEITNPSDGVARFDAVGLYFVPDRASSAEEPQRLGVVSAGQVAAADGTWINATDVIDVAPHAAIKVKLTTYCIDAKRHSPSLTTKYHLANRRMPTELTRALAGVAHTVESIGYDPGGAGAETRLPGGSYYLTQKAIWRVRESMPVALVGDAHRVTE